MTADCLSTLHTINKQLCQLHPPHTQTPIHTLHIPWRQHGKSSNSPMWMLRIEFDWLEITFWIKSLFKILFSSDHSWPPSACKNGRQYTVHMQFINILSSDECIGWNSMSQQQGERTQRKNMWNTMLHLCTAGCSMYAEPAQEHSEFSFS